MQSAKPRAGKGPKDWNTIGVRQEAIDLGNELRKSEDDVESWHPFIMRLLRREYREQS